MKKNDIIFILVIAIIATPFIVFAQAGNWFMSTTAAHPYIMAYIKFAILATIGEMIGLRIKTGVYNMPGYGMAARCVLWGLFGVWIALAMKAFATGVPAMVESMGVEGVVQAMREPLSAKRVLGSFATSFMLNSLFAPVFMTIHKMTDAHIVENGGKFSALFKPIAFQQIIKNLNWDVQWGFVFMKTIPFFWIPAHTITFLLPPTMQVLFAALLSISLGVFLSIAALLARKKQQ